MAAAGLEPDVSGAAREMEEPHNNHFIPAVNVPSSVNSNETGHLSSANGAFWELGA